MDRFSKQLVFAIGFTLMLAAPRFAAATPAPIKYKSSGSLTFVTAYFSYDGIGIAEVNQSVGKDNFGTFTGSCVAQVTATATTCTAPDGTAGLLYDLVASDCVLTHVNHGQIFAHAAAATAVQCASDSTGSYQQAIDFTVVGGTGIFATASGDVTSTSTGYVTAAPLGGGGGVFGGATFNNTGTFTK